MKETEEIDLNLLKNSIIKVLKNNEHLNASDIETNFSRVKTSFFPLLSNEMFGEYRNKGIYFNKAIYLHRIIQSNQQLIDSIKNLNLKDIAFEELQTSEVSLVEKKTFSD